MRLVLGLRKPVIAMIHVGALPGTPAGVDSPGQLIQTALEEAAVYRNAGVDAVAVENMHDVPYLKGAVGPEVTAVMSVIGREVRRAAGLPSGIQILAGANREAMAAALAAGLDFVRAEGYVFAHVADEGIIESSAGDLLRYRKMIGAQHIPVFADIKKKHCAHSVTADCTIAETARAAEFFRCDGVVVTGTATGTEAAAGDLHSVRGAVSVPVLAGSGVTLENVDRYLEQADALIVGSWFKTGGRWENPVDPERVGRFMDKVRRLREPS